MIEWFRRGRPRTAAAAAVVLVALACDGSRSGSADAANELIIAWDASREPASLDGHIEPYQTAWLIDYKIADPLLILGPDGEFHPALAAGWSSNDVADEWTFTLKSGVVFQDGTPFDAEAVRYNVERILDPATRSGRWRPTSGRSSAWRWSTTPPSPSTTRPRG